MNRKTLITLSVAAIAVLAFVLVAQLRESSRYSASAGEMLFPELESRLADVTRVELRRGTETAGSTITLVKKDAGWGVVERGGYPANKAMIRRLMLGLTQMRLVEPKTRDPEKYHRLAVGDPEQDGAARLVRLLTGDGSVSAEVILGNSARGDRQYLRISDSAQSWSGSEKLSFAISQTEWLDRDLVDINQADITETRIEPIQGRSYAIHRNDSELTLDPPAPAGKRNKPGMLHRLQSVMQGLKAVDVSMRENVPDEGWARGTHTLKSGLVITLYTLADAGEESNGNALLRISVDVRDEADSAAADQAEKLRTRLAGHTYEIAAHQARMMGQTYDNLIEEVKE